MGEVSLGMEFSRETCAKGCLIKASTEPISESTYLNPELRTLHFALCTCH